MISRRSTDRGAAAVETALMLPILLLVVFGIIDFGRLLNAQITLTEAAREGARASALDAEPADRVARVTGRLDPVTTTVVTACPAAPTVGQDAEVTVSYTFRFVTPVGAIASLFAGGGFGDDLNVSGVGVMPCRA